jgi:hypothetical protein
MASDFASMRRLPRGRHADCCDLSQLAADSFDEFNARL